MKKIFLIFVLAVIFAGCASRRPVEQMSAYEMPARSAARPPEVEIPIATPAREIPVSQEAYEFPEITAPAAFYETEFDMADISRSHNIALAARSINGKVVRPGESFSFNETIGSTTGERGYKKGVIFVDGKKSEGYGGGVCQVSTTLCNAAHAAGMTLTERHDHSRPVAYVGDGLQAATSHNGGIDFRFQNDTAQAVRINAKAENGKVSVSVEKI